MLMTRIRLTNNSCGAVHLVGSHFNLHIAAYATVDSEMRSSEYASNAAGIADSHPFVAIVDLEDEYDNGDVELVTGDGFKYGATALVAAYTPGQGEPVWDKDLKKVVVGDGTTVGGVPVGGGATDLAVTTGVTNFPAASAGDRFRVTSAGWIGGAAGVGELVGIGDILTCHTTTIAGTKAAVGAYWSLQRTIATELVTLDADGNVKVS